MRLTRFFALAASLIAGSAAAQSWAWDDGSAPFVSTPVEVVDRMLRLAEPKPGELLVDLGSGDGRIVIEAARRYGARGLGIEIDKSLVERAREGARRAGVESLVRFEAQDLFETDLRGVDVVTLYLLPEMNEKLMPRLLQDLKPGARVVAHDYGIGPWPPDETLELRIAEKLIGPFGRSTVYLWLVPADARGTWKGTLPGHGGEWTFRIAQRFQMLEVQAWVQGHEAVVLGSRLRGEELRLVVTANVGGRARNHLFRGLLKGDRVDGEVHVSDGEEESKLRWTADRQP
jgi:SAM-dependent methyltransferase